MISPLDLQEEQRWGSTNILRIASENNGYIGFVDVVDSTTLIEARSLIWENIDNSPKAFQFILNDGVPISRRQESSHLASSFYPCLKIRESKIEDTTVSEKITVVCSNLGEFTTWVSSAYTFGQLRQDAIRYWNLNSSGYILQDKEKCVWPEDVSILSFGSAKVLHEKGLLLQKKPNFGPRFDGEADTHVYMQSRKPKNLKYNHESNIFPELDEHIANKDYEEQLWRIFTYHCVHGDALEIHFLKAYQFNKLLRDSKLMDSNLSPAMVDITYASEAKGRRGASGKMNYDEFLNAIMSIGRKKVLGTSNNQSHEIDSDEQIFCFILNDHIIPYASKWSKQKWDTQTLELRSPSVEKFVSTFLNPLFQIFRFYAITKHDDCRENINNVVMSYKNFLRFLNDFEVSSLQLSSKDIAEIFLSSCQSPPFGCITKLILPSKFSSVSSNSLNVNEDNRNSAMMAAAFLCEDSSVSRSVMSFSSFIDGISRLGLTAYQRLYHLETLSCVKAIFQHLNRCLKRSRVMGIISNNHSGTSFSAGFVAGSIEFTNLFINVWKNDYSPDYLMHKKYVQPVCGPNKSFQSRNEPRGRGKEILNRIMMKIEEDNDGDNVRSLKSLENLFDEGEFHNLSETKQIAPTMKIELNAGIDSTIGNEESSATLKEAGSTSSGNNVSNTSGMESSSHNCTSFSFKNPKNKSISICLEDEEGYFKRLLQKGGVFRKHGQWGNPHRRYVWCNDELSMIHWRPLNQKKMKAREGFAVADVVEVISAESKRLRTTFLKNVDGTRSKRCFSLCGHERRLDLEADSEASKEVWMRAFIYLITSYRAIAGKNST